MHRDFKGVWIPKEFWLNRDLGWSEKALLVEISSLSQNSHGCFALDGYFAEFLGVSPGAVANLIRKLKGDGWLEIEGRGRDRTIRISESGQARLGEPIPQNYGNFPQKYGNIPQNYGIPIYRIINTEINTEEEHRLSVELSQSGKSRPKKKGSRLPSDFEVTAEMVAWAAERTPKLDLNIETEKFRNYWIGVAGAKGVKLDWTATWRNWMLNAESYREKWGVTNGKNQGATSTNRDKLAGYEAIFAKYRPEEEGE